MSGRQTRVREPINYSEKAAGATDAAPAWVKSLRPGSSSGGSQRASLGKENERDSVGVHPAEPPAVNKSGQAAAGKKKKASGQEAPSRGGRAGLKPVPIIDVSKQQQQADRGTAGAGHTGGGKAKKAARQNAAEDDREVQVVTRDVPGLAGVKQKRLECVPAALAAADAAPAEQEAAGSGSGRRVSNNAKAKRAAQPDAQEQQPAAKRQRSKSSGGSRPAARAAEAPREEEPQQQELAEEAAVPSATAASTRRPRASAPPAAAAAPEPAPAGGDSMDDGVLGRVARAVEAAVRAEAEAAAAPAQLDCQRCQRFSDNFAALLAEYRGLQREYEALKAARLSEDVEELLREHNAYVREHGQKAGELAQHWKLEAERREAAAQECTMLQERCRELEGEALGVQAELLDVQETLRGREMRTRELEARVLLLERHVTLPATAEQAMQTEDPEALSAGVQAPSLQSPGVQMYEARAMAPEGALGTVYKKGRPSAAAAAAATAGAAQPLTAGDNSYSIPATTMLPPGLAAGHAAGAVAAAATAGPTGGSDMQLAGEAAAPVRLERGTEAGQSPLLPVAGKLAHAAPRGGGGKVAPRRASLAPSPVQGPQQQQQQQQQVPVEERPGSAQLTAESLANPAPLPAPGAAAAVVAAARGAMPEPAEQARARRLSAPPAIGGAGGIFSFGSSGAAPLERQLLFASHEASPGSGPGLPAVREEGEGGAGEEEGQEQTEAEAGVTAVSGPLPPRDGAIMMLGLEATPCKGGKYVFTDRPSGFVFELGPASPDASGWGSDEDAGQVAGGPEEELCYRALQLGSLGPLLPDFLHGTIIIQAHYRRKLLHLIAEALAKSTPDPQQQPATD